MNRITANTFWGAGTAVALLSTLSIGARAQEIEHGIEINRGSVVYVSGNDLVVKMRDGNLKHFVVPGDSKLKVDGKDVAVRDLKPGTMLTQIITTTTTEEMVSEIRTVDGKVLEAKPPYLTIATGDKIKRLRVPEGTKFTVGGKEMMLADLREGMRVRGTVVTTVPTTVEYRTSDVSGQAPPPPKPVATPALVGVLLIEETEK